jgi:hypothetical protein
MRIKHLILLILPVLLTDCQGSLLTTLTRKDTRLFNESQIAVLKDTTAAIDYKYGFDPDLEIDYVFKAGTIPDREITAKSPQMKKILQENYLKDAVTFYEKIFEMKETQIWKMTQLREKKKWTDTTYIQKYILPETELYLDILEKNIIQLDTAYGEKIEKRKSELKKMIVIKLDNELKEKEKRKQEQIKPGWK